MVFSGGQEGISCGIRSLRALCEECPMTLWSPFLTAARKLLASASLSRPNRAGSRTLTPCTVQLWDASTVRRGFLQSLHDYTCWVTQTYDEGRAFFLKYTPTTFRFFQSLSTFEACPLPSHLRSQAPAGPRAEKYHLCPGGLETSEEIAQIRPGTSASRKPVTGTAPCTHAQKM